MAYFAKILGHLNVERESSQSDPTVNARLFGWAKEFIGMFPNDQNAVRLLFILAGNAESHGQLDTAREIYRFGQGLELDDERAVRGFEASLRWLDVNDSIGKPLALAGPTLAGAEISVEQLKGKVVLVDFWATWCGPCVQELPNVKKVYDKYHEEGLEIIAVSLDREKPDLEKFVADRKIPWPQIFFDDEDKQHFDNPLAQQFGIQGIPQTFLLDRAGKLAKIGVRGAELEQAVKELLKAPVPESN
jgi:thiol-disulfide isomerase/thioredoxin